MKFPIFVIMLLLAAWGVPAQTFTTLHSLGVTLPTGSQPLAPLIQGPEGTLYGTTEEGGGTNYSGTVFAINTDNVYRVLYSFTGGDDGENPKGGLLLSGNRLYGTTSDGGTNGRGVVFAVNTDGSGFTNLYSFTGVTDGANPQGSLILSGNTLYGTTFEGGTNDSGVVFAINTDGSGFTNLYDFTGGIDGDIPYAGLILSGNTLYGTTIDGGTNNRGVVFAVNTNGSGFTNLHSFTSGTDGGWPLSNLILSGNRLYGTASIGGTNDSGAVFAINTDGSGFTNVYSFTGDTNGGDPYAGLILSGNTLYGTTDGGGAHGYGVVFAVNTDGSGFTNFYSFTGGADGGSPQASLLLSGNVLYGTTESGGVNNSGVVFAVNTNGSNFTDIYHFAAGTDGANPYAGLLLSGNVLYGTTRGGGTNGYGVVFAVNTDGSGFMNLHRFTGGTDGANPYAGLLLSGNTLYGTAYNGGTNNSGVVFAVNTDGSGFTNLYSFTGGTDGANPYAGLILSGNTLYGTAYDGGADADGAVFAVNTDGSGFTNLYSFTSGINGRNPESGLLLSGNTLYGTTFRGTGSAGSGTVFAVNTDGTGFTNLYRFTGNNRGNPQAGLILSGNTLYGTTTRGGTYNVGAVFAVDTDGAGFTNLYSFTGGTDGANPYASLILSGNTLYGTTESGGTDGVGAVFAVNTNGINFTTLYSFTGGTDGENPQAELILSSNTLYGTAYGGGDYGDGAVFSLTVPDTITANAITYSRNNLNTWHVRVSTLLTNAVDAQGDPLFLAAVSASTNGITPVISQGYVQYYNANLVDDQFTYTVTNSVGISATGTITLQAAPLMPMGGQINGFTLSGGTATMTFGGVSGYLYDVQVSTNLTDWTTLETTNAPANGIFQFIDTAPPIGSAFYRLEWAP